MFSIYYPLAHRDAVGDEGGDHLIALLRYAGCLPGGGVFAGRCRRAGARQPQGALRCLIEV